MRLAHLADQHLGFRQYQRENENGANQREADVAEAFRLAVDGVVAARPDIIVLAGDLFHAVRPTNAAIVLACRQMRRLRETAPTVLIAGNHDTPRTVQTGSILRLFEDFGVDIATHTTRRFVYPHLDLAVTAVPHAGQRPAGPEGTERYRVLLIHGEVEGEGLYPEDRSSDTLIPLSELSEEWSYIALGHYHIQHQVAPRAWYSGSLEYVSSNIWGELVEEKGAGKGWLLVDLDTGQVERQPVPQLRGFVDLEPVDASSQSPAAIDAMIADRMAAVPGGIADKLVRLIVHSLPRHVLRELDYAAIRAYKAEALHLHLDLRRPQVTKIGSQIAAAVNRGRSLPELLSAHLAARELPADMDRGVFVRLGREIMEEPE